MRAYRVSLGAFAIALVATIGFGAWSWPHRVDGAAHDAYVERLVRVETLVNRLLEQVLRVHAGLTRSFDPLVQTMHEIRDVHTAASRVPPFVSAEGRERVLAALQASTSTLEPQAVLIEHFKSENTTLLHSLTVFPLAAASMSESLTTAGDEPAAAELRDLLRDVLRMVVSPTPSARAEVQSHLASLDAGPLALQLHVLLTHAELIVREREEVDNLLREILAAPAVANARALMDAYVDGYTVAVARAQSERTTLFVLSLVVVLLGAATIILRLQASADELERTSRRLAQAVEAQNRFVSMTSHEFRTPLSVIVSSAEMLDAYAEKWAPESRTKHLRRIDRAARGMTDLLDGLLLIGRTDAGHREFRATNVDVEALVTESVEAQRARAKDGITVELVTETLPPRLRLDARLLRHVLDNLVSNAVKYNKPGGSVRVLAAYDARTLRFEVIDHGIGIPAEHLARLFDTFARAKNVGAVQGTGLGLAIVKRAVDQHAGRIEAQSEEGVGTTFSVWIPIEGAFDRDTTTGMDTRGG